MAGHKARATRATMDGRNGATVAERAIAPMMIATNQRDSRRSGDPSAPRSRSKTRDLHERSSSASNGRGDSREDYGRRGSSSRDGSGSSRDDYGDGRRSGSSRDDYGDARRSGSGSSRGGNDDGRRGGSGSSRGGYDDSRRDGGSRNSSSSRSGDSRRAYDQADAPDRYDSPRSRGRSSTRSFADEERTRPPSASDSRDDRRGSGDAWGGGSSRAPRGSSADDWGRGGNGRSSRGIADGAAGWGAVADGFSIGDDSPWPDEPQEWSTWSDNGPKGKNAKVKRGKGETPATGGGIKARFKRAWAKPMQRGVIIVVLVSLGLCTISSLLTGIVGASSVDPALWNAYVGYTHLKTGETLLKSLTTGSMNTSTVREAEQYFLASQQDFTASHDAMLKIPSFAETAPFVGNKVQVGIRLTALAATFSQLAAVGCDAGSILVGAVANPFGSTVANGSAPATPTPGSSTAKPVATATSSTGLTPANLTQIQKDLKTINDLLTAAAPQIDAIQPGDLSFQPKLESEFNQFKAMLPQIHSYLDEATTIMGIAGPLLGIGHPAYYFVELLDSTEIRPGGGFIGNYGTMIVKGGVLAGLHVQDVDLLDQPFTSAGGCIPMPTRYLWFTYSEGITCWSLRDSNFEPDFPTSAQYGEQNYSLEGGPYTFQGVVAITPWMIEKFIALTGPIAVPEVKDPTTGKTVVVTSTNLVDMIHQFQLGAGHGSNNIPDPASQTSQRKAFTGFLFKHFMDKLKTVIKNNKTGVLKTILNALATKDVQIYFNNPVAEGLLKKYNMASVVLAPKTGDSQLVVDANVIANKANNFITYTLNDTVTINKAGDATHNLTLDL